MPFSTTIAVNGEQRAVTADDDTPLLWVLRDDLALTGTKFGCGIAECGACTVLLDGNPIRSCSFPLAAVGRAQITTIEGIAGSHGPALQAAWVAEDVPQCGYCQSGMIVEAAALLAKHAAPSDAQIDDAMQGHICRCGTYPRIRRAIERAAKKTQA